MFHVCLFLVDATSVFLTKIRICGKILDTDGLIWLCSYFDICSLFLTLVWYWTRCIGLWRENLVAWRWTLVSRRSHELCCQPGRGGNCIPSSFCLWFRGKGHEKRKKPRLASVVSGDRCVGTQWASVTAHPSHSGLCPFGAAPRKHMCDGSSRLGSTFHRLFQGLPYRGPSGLQVHTGPCIFL